MRTIAPQPVQDFLLKLDFQERQGAYIQLDPANRFLQGGGELELYLEKLPEKGEVIRSKRSFLEGLLPHSTEPLSIPFIDIGDGVIADIHIFNTPAEGGDDSQDTWVIFLDSTASLEVQRRFQQASNSANLKSDLRAKLLNQFLGESLSSMIQSEELNLEQGGEWRVLSILFADIRSFTDYCEKHDPRDVLLTVNAYISEVIGTAQKHGAVIDKIIGDSVMALFGIGDEEIPPGHSSVRAGIEILEKIAGINVQRKEEGKAVLSVGVGIATGVVTLGIMGTKNRKTLSAFGDRVNLAARLEATSCGDEILIDEATLHDLPEEEKKQFRRTHLKLQGIPGKLTAFSSNLLMSDSKSASER